MKQTALALGLAMATSVGFAAPGNTTAQVGVDAGANAADNKARIDTDASAQTQFNALDRNGDGVLSRAEASASDTVSQLYDSLDTRETIEHDAKQGMPDGITREQFQAGIQARESGSGSFGPAVSGGETYTIMRDGSRKLKETASQAQSQAGNAVTGAVNAVSGTANTRSSANAGAEAGGEAAVQRQRSHDKARSMQDRARGGAEQARSEAEMQRDRAHDKATSLQERARGQSNEAYGQSRSRVEGAARTNGSLRQSHDQRSGSGSGAGVDAETHTRINAD